MSFDVRPAGTFPSIGVTATGRAVWQAWASPYPVAVAHVAGRIVGLLVHSVRGATIDVRIVWVAPSMRNRGIATQLLACVRRETIRAKVITTAGLRFLLAVGSHVQDCRHRRGAVR